MAKSPLSIGAPSARQRTRDDPAHQVVVAAVMFTG
jgi:hypothetical protein